MFLDEGVRTEMAEYDALAIVEWDVLVASDRSFEELHHAAFRGNEDFWVKGSNLEGTNFHSTAQESDMWNMLGHINGNAIYNNNDPAFVEYVDYTRTRWEYTHPYDIALWLTISDFPYSWPLWQRFSSKFVTTNLISYVGLERVDHSTVSNAIAGQTLFIHGSGIDEGNLASLKIESEVVRMAPSRRRAKKSRKLQAWRENEKWKTTTKWQEEEKWKQDSDDDIPNASRIGRMLKGGNDSPAVDKVESDTSHGKRKKRKLQAWRENEKWKTTTKWQEVEKWRQDNDESDGDIPKWRRQEKWKYTDGDEEPKWRQQEKWKNNFCDEDECPITYSNGLTGRVCDESCADGDPYGTNGCSAVDGKYGDYCRTCYFDRDRAVSRDDPDDRAIMCSSAMPVTAYATSSTRRLTVSAKESVPPVPRLDSAEGKDAQSMFAEAAALPYVNDLVRGNLCAFFAGEVNEVERVEVAVMSVLQFLPGMTVAVAADTEGFDAYERAVGGLPGVTVYATEDPVTASLFADKFCGVDASLIFYMQHDSVVSRSFTSKDTHSTHGDLLVVHGSPKLRRVDRELAKQTTAVLGFESPSFTFNTDLFLPAGINADLRKVLVSGMDPNNEQHDRPGDALAVMDGFMTLRDMSAVPQVMAALAYSRNTPGVWFIDPQTWVSQHLFKTASIWEIPLVKPRFTCTVDKPVVHADAGLGDLGVILQANLDFFTHGGTCDGGYIDMGLGD
eukprot:jgi/Undpi1/6777/HiC_scaffold_21.g09255.m2